jgi:hypothetical protein
VPVPKEEGFTRGEFVGLQLVNLIRERLAEWRAQGYPNVTRRTLDLLEYWRRDGREQPLFFAQLEAVETIIFLTEARADSSFRSESAWTVNGEPASFERASADYAKVAESERA